MREKLNKQLVHRTCRAVCHFLEIAFLIAVPVFAIWWTNDYNEHMKLLDASISELTQVSDKEATKQNNEEDVVVAVDSQGVLAYEADDTTREETDATEKEDIGICLQDITDEVEYAAKKQELADLLALTGAEWEYQQSVLLMAETEPKAVCIIERATEYPAYLIETLGKYPQTLDYVYGYPEHKDDEIAGNVGTVIDGEIPLLLQWDARWGYGTYGAGLVGTSGCGPTCLSMVVVGLTGKLSITPKVVCEYSEEAGYYVAGSGTTWALMTTGAQHYGLKVNAVPIDEESVKAELEAGRPIICSVGPGDFTVKGHYIVMTAYKNNQIQINDPNSCGNSGKLWNFADIKSQIQGMWSYEVEKTDLEQ